MRNNDVLENVMVEISKELAAAMLLSTIPRSFENFVVAIETRDKLPSLAHLKTTILEARTKDKGALA